MSVDSRDLRRAMGLFPTGVAVVTTRRADGRAVGTTVNALTSVSLSPPLVLVCLARDSVTLAATRESSRFAINILAEDQHEHSRRFAVKGDGARPEEVPLDEHELGVPLLRHSLATLACEVERIDPAGDHEIVIGEVVSTTVGSRSAPLVFFGGEYAALANGSG